MIIGIDLGTTFSLCSYFSENGPKLIPNSQGKYLTPSIVHFKEDKTFTVGDCSDPSFLHHVSYFKEFMGTTHKFTLGKQEFSPVELSTFVLKQLKSDAETFLGVKVTEAVISVPAYFNDNQRIATKQAGQLAGLATTRIINEPSAAALAYRGDSEEATLLVFDFGGGTLDVSVVDCFENIIEILSISGDNHLGGKTVDDLIAHYFCEKTEISFEDLDKEEQKTLLLQSQQAKEALSKSKNLIFSFKGKDLLFTREILEDLILPLFKKMKQIMANAVRDSGKVPSEIDQVVLVGGSSHLVGLSAYISELMGKVPVSATKPQEVVALGMGFYAGIKSRNEAVEDIILTDVCPFTLGIGVVHGPHDHTPHVSPMIPRNTTLPAIRRELFSTVHDDQEKVQLTIVQGEAYYQKDNLLLEELSITVDPGTAGTQGIEVTFTYDLNGILQVDIVHLNSGRSKSRAIVSQGLHYSEFELHSAMEALNRFKLASSTPQEDPLLTLAREAYPSCDEFCQKQLSALMGYYEQALEMGTVEKRKASRRLQEFLDYLADDNAYVFDSDWDFAGGMAEEESDELEDFDDMGELEDLEDLDIFSDLDDLDELEDSDDE